MASFSRVRETLYFTNAAGSIFYHAGEYVRLAWNASAVSQDIIQAYYEEALKLLLSVGVHKILSQHEKRQPILPAAQHWLTHDWIPRAVNLAKLQYCAIVEGANPIHRLSTRSVVSESAPRLVFRLFSTQEEAHKWLLSMPAKKHY